MATTFSFPESLNNLYMQLNELRNCNNPNSSDIQKKISKRIQQLQERIDSNLLSPKELKTAARIVTKHHGETCANSPIEAILEELCQTIIKKAGESLSSNSALITIPPAPPVLNLFFGCDLDAIDHNGTVIDSVLGMIEEKTPVVTTRSVLLAYNINDTNKRKEKVEKTFAILGKEEKYDFYLQKNSDLLLVFPKNYPYPYEKLGFNDNNLEKVSLFTLLQGPTKECSSNIEEFEKFFNKDSTVGKRLIIDGHGRDGTIAALNLPHYQKFLKILNEVHTEALDIRSCFSGGVNTLQQNYFDEQAKATFPAAFPILIENIGSFVSYGNRVESGINFFHSIDEALKNFPSLKNSNYKNSVTPFKTFRKNFNNFAKIQFPSHEPEGFSTGFRPLQEGARNQIISYSSIKKEKLQFLLSENCEREQLTKSSLPVATPEQLPTIQIKNKEVLQILPLYVEARLDIIAASPKEMLFLHSDIPGDAHHLIPSITSSTSDLKELFTHNANIYKESSARKAFFINEFISPKNKTTQIVMDFAKFGSRCYYKEGSHYYCWNFDATTGTINEEKITETEHAFALELIRSATEPLAKAVQVSSGGQEDDAQFSDKLHQLFWGKAVPHDCARYLSYFSQKLDEEKRKQAVETLFKEVDPSSHQMLLELALIREDHLLAKTILEKSTSIDVNKKTYNGELLLNIAIVNGYVDIVTLLLKNNGDINLSNEFTKTTPLMVAMYTENLTILEVLLQKENKIIPSATDSQGLNALFYIKNPEIIKFVLDRIKIDLDLSAKSGLTFLSYAAGRGDKKIATVLLELGAKISAGHPTPLESAMESGSKEMVEFLLENGAPLEAEVLKKAALGSSEMLEFLLTTKKFNASSLDLSIFTEAMLSAFTLGLTKNGLLLLESKPEILSEELLDKLITIYPTLILYDLFSCIIKMNPDFKNISLLLKMASLLTAFDGIDKAKQFIKESYSESNQSPNDHMEKFSEQSEKEVLDTLLSTSKNKEETFYAIIEKGSLAAFNYCVENKGDLFNQTSLKKILEVRGQNLSIWAKVVENKIDLTSTGDDSYKILPNIISTGNSELVQLCIENLTSEQLTVQNYYGTNLIALTASIFPKDLNLWRKILGKNIDLIRDPQNSGLEDIIIDGSPELVALCLENISHEQLEKNFASPNSILPSLAKYKDSDLAVFKKILLNTRQK